MHPRSIDSRILSSPQHSAHRATPPSRQLATPSVHLNSANPANPVKPAPIKPAEPTRLPGSNAQQLSTSDLTKIFNAAVLCSRSKKKRDFSAELAELTESAAFKSILNSVRQLARVQGIKEREAAEQVLEAFRKIDDIWGEYMFCEGREKLRKPRT